jgi:hypothetical protein
MAAVRTDGRCYHRTIVLDYFSICFSFSSPHLVCTVARGSTGSAYGCCCHAAGRPSHRHGLEHDGALFGRAYAQTRERGASQ